MRDAEARGDLAGVGDVVVIVPVACGGVLSHVLRGAVVEVEAWADVAEVAVSGGGRGPVFAGVGLGVGLWLGRIEGLNGGKLGLVEFGELRL